MAKHYAAFGDDDRRRTSRLMSAKLDRTYQRIPIGRDLTMHFIEPIKLGIGSGQKWKLPIQWQLRSTADPHSSQIEP